MVSAQRAPNNDELSMMIKFNQTFVQCPHRDPTFNQLISLFFFAIIAPFRAPFMSRFLRASL